ncbi:hypothetical protein EIP86_010027 [Pleurotus ostreatoroseus]|nr:hypothetical protein EIP86_010027 [Pleurotus ostreatoroseus]
MMYPLHYVPADFDAIWGWETSTSQNPTSRYVCVDDRPVTFAVLGTVVHADFYDEDGTDKSLARLAIAPRWYADLAKLEALLRVTANPMKGALLNSPSSPRGQLIKEQMAPNASPPTVPFDAVFDARDAPLSAHWAMPRLHASDIEVGDQVVMECRLYRYNDTTAMPTGTWDTALELMGVTLLEKHQDMFYWNDAPTIIC